jgi:chromosomal replication initiator protein
MYNADAIGRIAPLVLERAVEQLRPELPDEGEALDRLFRYLEFARPTTAEIRAAVCEFYALTPLELVGDYRQLHITWGRQVYCYLVHRYTRLSTMQIGRYVNRDHTTVMHAIHKVEALVLTKPLVTDDIDLLRLRISEKMLMRRRAAAC